MLSDLCGRTMAKRSDSCWPLSGLLFYPPVSGSPVYGEQSRAFSFGNTGCGIRGTGTVWIFWVHPGAFGAFAGRGSGGGLGRGKNRDREVSLS